MSVQLGDVIRQLGSVLSDVDGDSDLLITGVASLDRAGPGDITFCREISSTTVDLVRNLESCAVIVPDGSRESLVSRRSNSYLYTANPRLAFLRVVAQSFPPSRPGPGIHPTAVVTQGSRVDPSASVGAHSFIGADVAIGPRTIIYANVSIYGPATLGADVRVFSGTVIGADGFGYERNSEGALESFPHVGGVVIEDDVEIGANTCIDRGTLNDTEIRSGARIDNLVHISHNVVVGRRAAVIANSMIAGGVTIGADAWIAPSASVLNQKDVGAGSTVGIGAVVLRDVLDNEVVMGSPALAREEYRQRQSTIRALVEQSRNEGV